MKIRSLLIALACIGVACAPTRTTSRVVGVQTVHLRTDAHARPSPPLYRRASVDADSGDVVVEVDAIQGCTVLSRSDRQIEDRTERGPSWGMIVPGACSRSAERL
jgi:hypothetical protein